jgi:hypothetical protein
MGIALKGLVVLASLLLVFLLWVATGRYISLLLDRVKTISFKSLPTTPLTYDGTETGGTLQIGDQLMSTQSPDYAFPLRITHDSQLRIVVSMDGKSFLLAPESGDETSFTLEHSLLSWPTPFDFNFMTGQSPSWKRHLYFVLRWKKRSGSKLKMVWRYEQYFYSSWEGGFMTRVGSTGLIQVEVTP